MEFTTLHRFPMMPFHWTSFLEKERASGRYAATERVVICYDDIFAIFFASIFLLRAGEICSRRKERESQPASGSIKFCHALWQVPFSKRRTAAAAQRTTVDLLDVNDDVRHFPSDQTFWENIFLDALGLQGATRMNEYGVVVAGVAQPPISCCEL